MRIEVNVAGLAEHEIEELKAHKCEIQREAYQIDKVVLQGTKKLLEHTRAPITEFFKIELDDGTQVLEVNVKAFQLSLLIVDVDLQVFET